MKIFRAVIRSNRFIFYFITIQSFPALCFMVILGGADKMQIPRRSGPSNHPRNPPGQFQTRGSAVELMGITTGSGKPKPRIPNHLTPV